MYDDLSPHAAHDRVAALLRQQNEFKTANGNAFTARMVGADIELSAAGRQRRINFGEFSMFIRSAQRMTLPDMTEFARFTNAAAALLAMMDAVVAQTPVRTVAPPRERPAAGRMVPVEAPPAREARAPPTPAAPAKRTPVGYRGYQ